LAADGQSSVPIEQTTPTEVTATTLSYAVGLRIRTNDLTDLGATSKLLPLIGLRYGRWKLGSSADIDEWLAFNSFRKEPTVSFDLAQSDRIKAALSLRIQNIKTGESFDFIESGRKTLRGRALVNYKLGTSSFLGFEVTQDLLNRGDGTTVSLGVSESFRLTERSLLIANAGVTWANAIHWQAGNPASTAAGNLSSGLGSVGVGASYRYSPSPSWAWYTSVGSSRLVGEVGQVLGTQWRFSGQLGILYFGKLIN
jgi:hypothetical protein